MFTIICSLICTSLTLLPISLQQRLQQSSSSALVSFSFPFFYLPYFCPICTYIFPEGLIHSDFIPVWSIRDIISPLLHYILTERSFTARNVKVLVAFINVKIRSIIVSIAPFLLLGCTLVLFFNIITKLNSLKLQKIHLCAHDKNQISSLNILTIDKYNVYFASSGFHQLFLIVRTICHFQDNRNSFICRKMIKYSRTLRQSYSFSHISIKKKEDNYRKRKNNFFCFDYQVATSNVGFV